VRLVVCAVEAVWRVTRHTASTAHITSRTFHTPRQNYFNEVF
jgi:hypothetical protein